MKRILSLAAAALLAALSASASLAESLDVTPGQWKTTVTMTMPYAQEPIVKSATQCLDKGSYDPARDMEMPGECEIVEQQVSGNTLTWRMQCRMAEGTAVAVGRATFDGARGHGRMDTEMTMQGQTMSTQMEWQSERIGDC
ncbi:MAG: DUF3617 family protein [Rhodovibrionaceae bacterium]|nr:DUF3617 family protein [Rhodovibrionaceae bacterium]